MPRSWMAGSVSNHPVMNKYKVPSHLYKELLPCTIFREHFFNWELDVSQDQRVQYSKVFCLWKMKFSIQSSPTTLCDPIDSSPPGSPVPRVLQARTLGWVAVSFSNAWKWKVKVKPLSLVRLLATPWTAAYQAPPSKGFSKQGYWSGVPLPSPEVLIKRRHIHFSLMGLCIFLNLYTIFLMEIIMYELSHLTNNTEKYSHIMFFLKGT